jgi:signal peptidase
MSRSEQPTGYRPQAGWIRRWRPSARPIIGQVREQILTDLAEESLARAGRLTLRVTGTSMLPAIRPGSRVEIRRSGEQAVSRGDIVLVRAPNGFRLHRLVDTKAGWIITKGDNHTENDPPEPMERLLGVAVRITRGY